MRTMTTQTGTLDGTPVTVLDLEEGQEPGEIMESSLPEADPAWRYTDRQGHEHAPEVYTDQGGVKRVRDWPSLVSVVEETYWCDECNDEHERRHRECRICGEQIEPGSRRAVPFVVPGARYARARLRVDSMLSASNEERTLVVGERTFVGVVTATEVSSWEGITVSFEVTRDPARPS